MIQTLSMQNFSLFRKEELTFGTGLNVVIGSNATGKSSLLKLAYTCAKWSHEMAPKEKTVIRPDKSTLQKELASKLTGVFRCDSVGRLSSRDQGAKRTEVGIEFSGAAASDFKFSFSTRSTTDAQLDKAPESFFGEEAVFIPTKEMLTMFPGFAALYRNYSLQIDETYYDLCLALEKPLPRGPRLKEVKPMHGDNRFFALATQMNGTQASIETGLSAEEIEPIAALDAEISQSDRYLESQNEGKANCANFSTNSPSKLFPDSVDSANLAMRVKQSVRAVDERALFVTLTQSGNVPWKVS